MANSVNLQFPYLEQAQLAKETTANEALRILDLDTGVAIIALTNGTNVVSLDNSRAGFLRFTGTLTAAASIVLDGTLSKGTLVYNQTAGGQAVTVQIGSGGTPHTLSGSLLSLIWPGGFLVLGGAGHQIADEGTPLTPRGTLAFIGPGVVAEDDALLERTLVTVAGTDLTDAVIRAPASGLRNLITPAGTYPAMVMRAPALGQTMDLLKLLTNDSVVGLSLSIMQQGQGAIRMYSQGVGSSISEPILEGYATTERTCMLSYGGAFFAKALGILDSATDTPYIHILFTPNSHTSFAYDAWFLAGTQSLYYSPDNTKSVGIVCDNNGKLVIGGKPQPVVSQASVTWDPPSLAAGASTSTTVTVSGAVSGDMATASFPGITAGLVLTAQGTDTNTVTAYLYNGTAGVQDLASGTLRVTVWRQ